jgi:predicted dehydrogenase
MERVGLIGLGLVGAQRLQALRALESERKVEIVGFVDPNVEPECGPLLPPSYPDLSALLDADLDCLIISTPHDVAVDILRRCLPTGVRTLVEKPLGRSGAEANALLGYCVSEEQLFVGFNYRFLAGVGALLADVQDGLFGALISMSMVFGHGGAPGDEQTWKLDPRRAGSGCLLDPGIHLLNLLGLVAGSDIDVERAIRWSGFWNTGIDEEAHLLLASPRVPIVSLQLSLVRWRSTFRIEVHGVDGYGIVEGRGRSYGPQSYRRGRRWGWRDCETQAASEELVVSRAEDDSFARELDVLLGSAPSAVGVCGAREAVDTMRLFDRCMESLDG